MAGRTRSAALIQKVGLGVRVNLRMLPQRGFLEPLVFPVLILREMYQQYAEILDSVGETSLADHYRQEKEELDTQIG